MVKGPKLLNPADKARKEARKKELKKNKKQRQQVRSAAIENRNPEQIIVELEQLDKQEYDPEYVQQNASNASQISISNGDILYKEKRKRLKELFAKILSHYEKEDPDRHSKLKTLEIEYEAKRRRTEREFEAVRAAQEVKIEDVFLPPEPDDAEVEIADDDPLLSETVYITSLTEGLTPPGCPPGPPPDLKQLVESLKTSIDLPSQIVAVHMSVSPHLMNIARKHANQQGNKRTSRECDRKQQISSRSNESSGSVHNQRRRAPARGSEQSKESFNQVDTTRQQKLGRCSVSQNKERPERSKPSAVIESKPVIFMPKATKFVPASVRSKIVQCPHNGPPATK